MTPAPSVSGRHRGRMHVMPWWARDAVVLGDDAPLPVERPFTATEADALGVDAGLRRRLVHRGLLRPVLRGVFVAGHVEDSLRLRVSALKLIVPEHAIATDRTAAWLHEVDALPRSAIHRLPDLDVFSNKGSRIRRPGVASGVRDLVPGDLMELEGLRLTTPLRTACDLGRLLWRFDALGAIDGFLRRGLDHARLLGEVDRFKGYRGILQLRELAPLGDGSARVSAGERTAPALVRRRHRRTGDPGLGVRRRRNAEVPHRCGQPRGRLRRRVLR